MYDWGGTSFWMAAAVSELAMSMSAIRSAMLAAGTKEAKVVGSMTVILQEVLVWTPRESVAVTVKVSVPAAVGVPLIVRLTVPLPGNVSPGDYKAAGADRQRHRAGAPAGRDRLAVGYVHDVCWKGCRGRGSAPG